jgi:hypothetical protein
MDPTANLKEQLELAKRILCSTPPSKAWEWSQDTIVEDADRLAELVLALDEWLCTGGAYPERWQGGQR